MHDIANYIVRGKLWDAFEADEPVVVLIDEIDKADIEFPNDLLLELDRMQFFVYETRKTVAGAAPPGRDHHLQQREGAAGRLPAPLLLPLHPLPRPRDDGAHRRRRTIPDIKQDLAREALNVFFQIRDVPGLKKKPATSRAARLAEAADGRGHAARGAALAGHAVVIPPLHGALLKNEQDVHLFERLAFLRAAQG